VKRGEFCQTLDFMGETHTFSALGDPCPPLHLVKVGGGEDNTLGIEEGNTMGRGVCCEHKKEISLDPYCVGARMAQSV
jgi:hypothetical protein